MAAPSQQPSHCKLFPSPAWAFLCHLTIVFGHKSIQWCILSGRTWSRTRLGRSLILEQHLQVQAIPLRLLRTSHSSPIDLQAKLWTPAAVARARSPYEHINLRPAPQVQASQCHPRDTTTRVPQQVSPSTKTDPLVLCSRPYKWSSKKHLRTYGAFSLANLT